MSADNGKATPAHVPEPMPITQGVAGRLGARSNTLPEATPEAYPKARLLFVWTCTLVACALAAVGGVCAAIVLISVASRLTH